MDTCDTVTNIDTLPPQSLEQLERQMIALLYAIWRAQGKSKRVVDIKDENKRGVEFARVTKGANPFGKKDSENER